MMASLNMFDRTACGRDDASIYRYSSSLNFDQIVDTSSYAMTKAVHHSIIRRDIFHSQYCCPISASEAPGAVPVAHVTGQALSQKFTDAAAASSASLVRTGKYEPL
jgi:hypothetical protein